MISLSDKWLKSSLKLLSSLEKLDLPLVLHSCDTCRESAQVPALSRLGVFAARIKAILPGGKLANHLDFVHFLTSRPSRGARKFIVFFRIHSWRSL